jgi:hypothetical protein
VVKHEISRFARSRLIIAVFISPVQIFHIQVLIVSIQFVENVTHKIIMKFTTKGKLERILSDKLSSATCYCEWRAIATQLDELKGLNIWRSIDVSSLYDISIVAKRMSGTVDMLNNGDSISCFVFGAVWFEISSECSIPAFLVVPWWAPSTSCNDIMKQWHRRCALFVI